VAKTSSGAGLGDARRGWWKAYGEALVAKASELDPIPTRQPSMGGALIHLVVSANCCAHLRVWEVGWGRGVLLWESRANRLAVARWGLKSSDGAPPYPHYVDRLLWVGPSSIW
jgi:hypothetical protein